MPFVGRRPPLNKPPDAGVVPMNGNAPTGHTPHPPRAVGFAHPSSTSRPGGPGGCPTPAEGDCPLLYLGPETYLPLASVVAGATGLALTFWQRFLSVVRRIGTRLPRRRR